jgi:hypothetical protein
MFDESRKCGLQIVDLLSAEDGRDQNLKPLFTYYTCLILSRAVFGVEMTDLRPGSEFVRKAERLFGVSALDKGKMFLMSNFPFLKDYMTVSFVPRDVTKYFNDIIR